MDATILPVGERNLMILKDGTRYPEAEKNLRLAVQSRRTADP